MARQQSDEVIGLFVDWLYDDCPVSPDEVTRSKLLSIWNQYVHEGTMPTREEILPHTRINAGERKATLLKILK